MVNESHIPNLTFQVGDACQLDFADGSFDIVLSLNVMAYHRDPVQVLLLKPQGLLHKDLVKILSISETTLRE